MARPGQKAEPTARAPASSQVAGLITGADDIKSPSSERLFEGSANRPFDACYHKACDTIENINRDVLEQNTRALVRALNAAAIAAQAFSTPSQKAVDLP